MPAVCAVVVGLVAIVADPVSAGGPAPTLKVAKHADGPYSSDIDQVNIPLGEAKSLHFKVKNENSTTVNAQLEGSSAEMLVVYRVKWFRGDKNITEKITSADGINVSLDPGTVKRYRARVKHREIKPNHQSFCLQLRATGTFPNQSSSVGINGICD
jgi:L-alanine-DL-glutamate epimerase-like enolase superfamily enzyme